MSNFSGNTVGKKSGLTFKKEERLKSKKIIEKLFSEGDSFLSFPLKLVYRKTELLSKYPAQATFSVGKRNFKLAVHRNRIKRKVRESYRLRKHELYDVLGDKQLALFFVFIGKEMPTYEQVDKAMQRSISRLIAEIKKSE